MHGALIHLEERNGHKERHINYYRGVTMYYANLKHQAVIMQIHMLHAHSRQFCRNGIFSCELYLPQSLSPQQQQQQQPGTVITACMVNILVIEIRVHGPFTWYMLPRERETKRTVDMD